MCYFCCSGNFIKKVCIFLGFNKNHYYIAGLILAYCVIHRGPKPSFFSSFLWQILSEGTDNVVPTVDDVDDFEIRSRLQAVSGCIIVVQMKSV